MLPLKIKKTRSAQPGCCPTCGAWLTYDGRFGYVCPRRSDSFHQFGNRQSHRRTEPILASDLMKKAKKNATFPR